jgi:erythromycin esterase
MMTRPLLLTTLLCFIAACATVPDLPEQVPEARPDPSDWREQVAAAAGERRVLQLGESGHGMAETYLLKTDLVRHLHRHHGFDVLAVEGGLAECWVTSQRLPEWSARQAMEACFWGAWASEEAEALFEYLRDAAASGRPLRLVGFDNSPTSRAFLRWLEAAPGLPAALLAAERDFINLFDTGRDEDEPLATTQDRAVANYRRAYAELDDPELRMIVADRLGTLDFDPADFDRELFELIREQRMAANLLQHMQHNPRSRVIVWAHNAHIAHAYSRFVGGVRRQGEYVHEALGEQGYTVGIYPLRGRGFAWFVNQEYDLRPPEPGSLEARLAELPGNPVFLDLHGVEARGMPWTREAVVSFEWGINEQLILPVEMYDGLILIREVSPITRRSD